MPGDWSYADVPDQTGRIVLITGASSGLGFALAGDFISRTSCEKLILACRSKDRAQAAIAKLANDPRLEFLELDLADLSSVRRASDALRVKYDRLDTLVLNAGVFSYERTLTEDGFEADMGVCHLGHFVLTAELWPLLRYSLRARIVVVASMAHETVKQLHVEDLNWETRRWSWVDAYAEAKLAAVFFYKELARRTEAAGMKQVTVVALCPGFAHSEIFRGMPHHLTCLLPCIAVPSEKLSINTLRAATDEGLANGAYLNPKRFKLYGPPVLSSASKMADDTAMAALVWAKSEELVHQKFDVVAA